MSFDKALKISKLAWVFQGQDEDLAESCIMIALLGLDNYLRCYGWCYGKWQTIPGFYLGLDSLLWIARNDSILMPLEMKNPQTVIPCQDTSAWLTCLPAPRNFLSMLRQKNEALANLFETNKGN